MRKNAPIFLAVFVLLASSLACKAFTPKMSLENPRMAYDQAGEQTTSTFTPTDVLYVVADLKNAPKGTTVKATWIAVDAQDTDPDFNIQEQTLDVIEDSFSGTIYFQLSNDNAWPVGKYRVEIYLNDNLSQNVEFNVE